MWRFRLLEAESLTQALLFIRPHTLPSLSWGSCVSVGRVGARQRVVRHYQADVVVVAVRLSVIGPADGQDVILAGGVL